LDGLAAGADLVHLGELGAGAGEADFESFGFGDAVDEVVADLDQALDTRSAPAETPVLR